MLNEYVFIFDYAEIPVCCTDDTGSILSENKLFTNICQTPLDKKNLISAIKTFFYNKNQKQCLVKIEGQTYISILFAHINPSNLYYFIFESTTNFKNIYKLLDDVKQIENGYLQILESLHDDFTITDKNGKLINVLPNFKSFYGISANQVIGKTVYELEEKGIFNPSIAAIAIKSGKSETRLQMTRTGKYLYCTAIPITDSNNNLTKIVSFSRDVTEYQMLKEQCISLETTISNYSSEIKKLRENKSISEPIITRSEEMKHIIRTIDKISKFDANVLLTGESGMGKTIYAKNIHSKSNRSSKPFIELNCGAIPENLFESELFGYDEGAFTGARQKGKMGWIEKANEGTLFLDEIADLPPLMQGKLLKTIDSKKIMRIGGTQEIIVDFRLISATNKNLSELVKAGNFREDLFFRLNVISIAIPPLREHRDDILPLITHFLKKNKEKHSIEKSITSKALDYLINYSWPGNVREIENLIENLVLTVENHMITEKDLPDYIHQNASYENFKTSNKTLPEVLASIEKKMILESYQKYNSTTKVAKSLGISQPSVSLKLKKYLSE